MRVREAEKCEKNRNRGGEERDLKRLIRLRRTGTEGEKSEI